MERFAMPRSRWAVVFIGLLAPRGGVVELGGGELRISVGLMGSARIPVERIERVSRMEWPGFAGLGVRIGRGLVAFVLRSGSCVVIETDREVSVRAPLPWRTRKILVRVEDPPELMAAIADARRAAP
jgi:hypothetical protein